jgi:hypothetical protein
MEYVRDCNYLVPVPFNFAVDHPYLVFHANQHLNCRVVKQLEPYMCTGIPIPLNLDKLHCIIIAMSCMHSHAHADSFAVVVSIASVICCSDLLLLG